MTRLIRIFFSEPPLKGRNLLVNGIGLHEPMAKRSVIHRPHGTGDFLIMLFQTPAQAGVSPAIPVNPAGTMIIWKPGDRHFYGHPTRGFLHSWIHCDGPLVRGLLESSEIPTGRAFPIATPDGFLRFLQDMHRELTTHALPDEIIAANLMENWLRDLARSSHGLGTQIPGRIHAVREYIDTHYAEPLSLEILATRAHWSSSHFSRIFRVHYGISPIDYLIRRRMQQASYLLHDANISITEVAQRTGYEDLYHFSKLFKKHLGLSPRALRQSYRPADR